MLKSILAQNKIKDAWILSSDTEPNWNLSKTLCPQYNIHWLLSSGRTNTIFLLTFSIRMFTFSQAAQHSIGSMHDLSHSSDSMQSGMWDFLHSRQACREECKTPVEKCIEGQVSKHWITRKCHSCLQDESVYESNIFASFKANLMFTLLFVYLITQIFFRARGAHPTGLRYHTVLVWIIEIWSLRMRRLLKDQKTSASRSSPSRCPLEEPNLHQPRFIKLSLQTPGRA